MDIGIGEGVLALILSFAAAIAAVALVRRGPSPVVGTLRDRGNPVFLFDGSDVLCCSASASASIGQKSDGFGWSHVFDAFRFRFPGFPETPPAVADLPMTLQAADPQDPACIEIEDLDGIIRVELVSDADARDAPSDTETHILRRAMNDAPYPAWRADKAGRVTWFNRAYGDLFSEVRGGHPAVDVQIFGATHVGKAPGTTVRASIPPRSGSDPVWYDVTMRADGENRMFYAVDVNAVVKAEIAQRNFVQTLAKTFAQLSFGLAIFDRNRQLALFNPALIDLTGLSAEFLSARPSLASFFDSLRENRTMPEPKNYGSWREKVAELDAGARHGTYQETWTLANGSTYRVNGRPHPDGAIAFLFEDISAEIGLTRRFRAELELSQAVLDQIEDAVVVFSATGRMKASNRAYRRMWGTDPEDSIGEVSIIDTMRSWHEIGGPSPVWGELRDFVLGREDRTSWSATVGPRGQAAILCLIDPIASAATLIRFRRLDAVEAGPVRHDTAAAG